MRTSRTECVDIIVIFALLVVSVHATGAQQSDPRSEPATALRECSRLLRSKSHAAFIETCILPIEVDRAKERFGGLENAVAEFGRQGGFELALKAFEAAMAVEPTFYDRGTRANYVFDTPIGGERRLQLRKVDGLWYWAD